MAGIRRLGLAKMVAAGPLGGAIRELFFWDGVSGQSGDFILLETGDFLLLE
jgi:hypothetical protein